jgi:hypothetical protein
VPNNVSLWLVGGYQIALQIIGCVACELVFRVETDSFRSHILNEVAATSDMFMKVDAKMYKSSQN